MQTATIKKYAILGLALLMSLSATGCKNFGKRNKKYAGVDGDYVSGTPLGDRQEGANFLGSNVDKTKFAPVHFGYDSVAILAADHATLDAVAGFLRSSSQSVIVAGFTDERGTPEYNRGLGERRAQAVRQYLIDAGADADRIQTVSFGAEMPVDSSSNEAAWAKNRRAEFGLVK